MRTWGQVTNEAVYLKAKYQASNGGRVIDGAKINKSFKNGVCQTNETKLFVCTSHPNFYSNRYP